MCESIELVASAPKPANDVRPPRGKPADPACTLASPAFTRYVRGTLRRKGIPPQDLPDTLAEVLVETLAAVRRGSVPATLEEWKALGATIAIRRAVDRIREARTRAKHEVLFCELPEDFEFEAPILRREGRDPVDTERYLAVLADLFEQDKMPELGAEILWAEAEKVPHKETAEELGLTETVVANRLHRMRVRFRTRLVELGMLP